MRPEIRQIGRYKVIKEIGRGGFGRVYHALDPSVGRHVAVKVLTESSPDLLTRFRNEAIVAGNLRHENIVTVYEYGEHEGSPFLAMEFLEGETLQQIIGSHKPLTLLEKCNIMSQVAEGLACAHESRVIHRDVKPANIMVLPGGRVKIMDFGIAKLLRNEETTRLTQEGFVIGTLLYMSPEQLKGTPDVDALCDIYSYGVIFFEFVAGRHPFQAADTQSLMYKAAFEEPPPIRKFVADFPDSLQVVISRTLAKDREFRYQSLKQVQFDIDPIRLELQRTRAAELLSDAQEHFKNNDLEQAQKLVREVLSLDPADRVARALWETLERRIQSRTIRPRIDALLKVAQGHLTNRRFTEAVQSYETALRLDSGNSEIRGFLEHSRNLAELSKKATSLLADARREFSGQNLTAAFRAVSEALKHDPQNPEASELLRAIQSMMERRQKEQRVEDAIRKAEGLLLLRDYENATAALTDLGPDANTSKVQLFLSLIEEARKDENRKERLRTELGDATACLRDRRFEDAVNRLQELTVEFPSNTEVANLLSYAQKEAEADVKARRIAEAEAKANELTQAHDFNAALAVVDTTLKIYAGDSRLMRLLGTMMAAKSSWEREEAIHEVVRKCEALRSEKRWAEALDAVQAALRDYAGDPALSTLLNDLQVEQVRQRREDATREVIRRAEELMGAGQPAKAATLIRRALRESPSDAGLLKVLEQAEREQQAADKLAAIESLCDRSKKFGDANEFDRALQLIESGLGQWPGDPTLLQERERHLLNQRARQKEDGIPSAIERATKLQRDKKFSKAAELLAKARRSFGDDAALVRLQEDNAAQWEQQKREESVRRIAAEARKLTTSGQLDEALRLLKDARSRFPGEPELMMAANEAGQTLKARQRAAAVASVIRTADQLLARQDFEGAIRCLEDALQEYPSEAALFGKRAEAQCLREEWEQEQAAQRGSLASQAASGGGNSIEPESAVAEKPVESAAPLPESARPPQTFDDRAIHLQSGLSNKKLVLFGSAAIVVIGALFAARWFSHPHGAVPLVISADPGVTVQIDGRECRTPKCNLELPPGTYNLSASRRGYESATQTFTVTGGEPGVKVRLPLKPLPELLEINSNFGTGSVVIDGRRAGDLVNGQFSASGLVPGRHTIRVTGADAEFEVEWRSTTGRRPELLTPIVAKQLQATVLTNAGDDGAIACNCGSEPLTIDGVRAGTSSPSGNSLQLSHLSAGVRQIGISDQRMVVEVRQNPALNIFLTLDRNVGTLVVDAREDNATVYVDNRPYRQKTSSGILRVPLAVGKYSVRVAKDGFAATSAQTVEVVKGQQARVPFVLSPLAAILEINGAVPGAQVSIDGQTSGEVGANGSVRMDQVSAGRHTIELAKGGYGSARFEAVFAGGKVTRVGGAQVAMERVVHQSPPSASLDSEAHDWERVRNSVKADELEDFIRKHPAGRYSTDARSRIGTLREQAQRNAEKQADDAAWETLDKNKKAALQEFVSHHPGSTHAGEARTLLARIEKQEVVAPPIPAPKAPEQRPAEAADTAAQDQQAITHTLATFESVYSRMDLSALRTIWQGMPETTADVVGKQFQFAKSLTMRLQTQGAITVTGDSASVVCSRTLSLVPKGSRRAVVNSDRVRVALARAGTGWVIRAITPY